MLQPDVRILAPQPRNGLTPQLRHLEDVGLVHRGERPPAAAGRLERHARHALDLRDRILERVHRHDRVLPARLAVVQSAGELPHDEQVDAVQAVGAEGGVTGERGVDRNRAEVRVDAQERAQREQPRLGFELARGAVERGVPDGAEQHGVGLGDRGARVGGERTPRGGHGPSADRVMR